MINTMKPLRQSAQRSLVAILIGILSCIDASALPNIESDGRLGSWAEFLQSMGYTKETITPNDTIFLDTDLLSAGEIVYDGVSPTGGWFYLNRPRNELRQNVGRLVSQAGGPDIVVYDFTEIVTSVPGAYFPSQIVILGQRPAAIVCQGMIGSYAPNEPAPEDLFLGAYLSITALNSCDPANPLGSRWSGTSPGGHGFTATYTDDEWGVTTTATGRGGSGGYGGSGVSGQNGDSPGGGLISSGGVGGSATFAWNVLQAGSPGGSGGGGSRDGSSPAGQPFSRPNGRGGQGGGAVLLKAEGSIAIAQVYANGAGGELGGGFGSGGHIIIDSPGTIRLGGADIAGTGNGGGGGVLEFRRSPRIIGIGSSSTRVSSGSAGRSELNLGVVGFPSGVSFPTSGSVSSQHVYRTSSRPDSAAPLISIQGLRTRNVAEGSAWTDAGATAVDNVDGSIAVTTLDPVNTAIPGIYEITYVASDSAGNSASKKRYINVVPNQAAARDPQSGLPQLVAATLRPLNPTTDAVDARFLPTFSFVTVDGQTYPSVSFLRRSPDFLPLGSYAGTWLDEYHRMKGAGLSYSFRTSTDLAWWGSQSLFNFTFVTRSNTRNGIVAPAGFEFATYRHNSATGSSPPRFYRVNVTADPLN